MDKLIPGKINLAKDAYTHEPEPAETPYLVGAHYFPGWKRGAHWGWSKIASYPERKPLLGWYNEGNPEIADWEIKWCLEHGISYFVYCWYRNGDNVGNPVTYSGQHLGHAIHEGLFNARYADQFKFAIMWETQSGVVSDESDLFNHLLPYWFENYFTRPNYLVFDNKPALYIYTYGCLQRLSEPLGGIEQMPRILDRMRKEAQKWGFDGLKIAYEYRGQVKEDFKIIKQLGFDEVFAYCWHTAQRFPTAEQVLERQVEAFKALRDDAHLPFIPTASVAWDPHPWRNQNPETPWVYEPLLTQWKLTPQEFMHLLLTVKGMMDALPPDHLGRRMLLLDNWNEWCEGHYIAPHGTEKFGYLDAVRQVFTSAPPEHVDDAPENISHFK